MNLICRVEEVGISPNAKISSSLNWKFSNFADILKRISQETGSLQVQVLLSYQSLMTVLHCNPPMPKLASPPPKKIGEGKKKG